jgi:hypothetical protein
VASLIIVAVHEYVTGLPNSDQLLDMLSAGQEEKDFRTSTAKLLYAEVISK